MKDSVAVHAAKREIIDRYLFLLDSVASDRNTALQNFKYCKTQEVGIQFDYKRNHLKSTCELGTNKRQRQKHETLNQIFTCEQWSRSFPDIGIVTAKPLQKKKVKRIYVENGCGTSYPVGSFYNRQRQKYSPNKKTISKCVGNCKVKSVVSEKLSPIIHVTGYTSSQTLDKRIIEIDKNTFTKNFTSAMTQIAEVLINKILSKETSSYIRVLQAYKRKRKLAKEKKILSKIQSKALKNKSSDSLLEQIHDLENCNSVDDRQSRCSEDPTENVLEREYRRLFASKSNDNKKSSKQQVQNKNASTLKRRIEALRRSFIKTGELTINTVLSRISSRVSANNERDVSIIFDSPTLEDRYCSQTKIYGSSALPSLDKHDEQIIYEASSINGHHVIYDMEVNNDAQKDILPWDTHYEEERDIQADNSMFEKFNFREGPPISAVYEGNIINERTELSPSKSHTKKKEKKKFFLFRKNNRKKPPETKNSITTGRCEVKNGLPYKTQNNYKREKKVRSQNISEVYEEMTKAAWVQKFVSDAIESQRSVKVRWNNKKYKTSSSTAFELIEKIYESTGIFRSKSDVIDSSHYEFFTKQHQKDYVPQNIEAWMMPTNDAKTSKTNSRKIKTALKKPNHEMEITLSGQKWFIEKSKAFSHKIELVLLSKNKFNPTKSSNYLQIDIPKGFFEDSNCGSKESSNMKTELDPKIPNQLSNEIAYKIIEYNTGNDLKKEINILKFDAANNKQNIQVTVDVKSNHAMIPYLGSDDHTNHTQNVPVKPQDVMSRDSKASIRKRRGVRNGISGQKDMRMIEGPIKKNQDCASDKSKHETKKCKHDSKKTKHESKSPEKDGERADAFLGNCPRLWTLEEIELFSWCASDCLLRSGSDDSTSTQNRYLYVTQSCPHILNGFGAIVSSCDASILFPVGVQSSSDLDYENSSDCYSRDEKKCILIRDQNGVPTYISCKRVFPKDSIEVYKRRQTIARSANRCKWYTRNCSDVPPQSASNNECQLSMKDEKEPCWKQLYQKSKANENTYNLNRDFLRDCKEPDYFSEMLIVHTDPEVAESFKSRHAVSCYEVSKKQITENPLYLTQIFDQELGEKMTTLSRSSESTSFELASNLLSRNTSLSYDEPSCPDCMMSSSLSPQRSSSFKQYSSKPLETTTKSTKTNNEILLTNTILSKAAKCPKLSSLPQNITPSANTRSAVNEILSKTFPISEINNQLPPLSDGQLPHLRNSSIVPNSSPSRPLRNSQNSFLSTVLSCSSIRLEDDDPSQNPCPPLTIEKSFPKINQNQYQDAVDDCHLLQQKHISVQSPAFNYKMRLNPKTKKPKNHSEIQCMMSRDIILPYPKPCRDQPDHSPHESPSLYNKRRRTSKVSPEPCQITEPSGFPPCWSPPTIVKHTDSFHLTKEALSAKKNKKDVNVKVEDEERDILLKKQNYRDPSRKQSSLPRNLYKYPLVQHCCGQKPHEQRLETDLPGKSCRIDSNKNDQKEGLQNKSDESTKTIEINFRFKVPNGNKPINMKVVEDNIDKNKVHLIDQILDNTQEVYISNKGSVHSGDVQSNRNDFNISICIKELKSNDSKKLDNCSADQIITKPVDNDMPPQNKQQSSSNKQIKKPLIPPKSSYFKKEESTSRCEFQEILINVGNDGMPLQVPKADIDNCQPKTKQKCTTQKPGTNIRMSNRTQCTCGQTIKKTVTSHLNTKIGETKILYPDKSDTCKYYTRTRKYEEHISRPGSKVMKRPKTEPECKPRPPTPAAREPKKRTSYVENMYSAANVVLSSNCSDSDYNENKTTDGAIYTYLKTNLMSNTNIMNPRTESSITLTNNIILNEGLDYPTEDNRQTINERTKSAYVASNNDTLPQNWRCNDALWDIGKKSCSKRNKRNLKSQQTYCDFYSERDSDNSVGTTTYVDVETQNSRYLTNKYTSPNLSMQGHKSSNIQNCLKRDVQLECTDIVQTPLTTQFVSSRGKQMRTLKLVNTQRIYNEENIALRNMEAVYEPRKAMKNMRIKKDVEMNVLKEASILQSYATKKAVLEIYTDNISHKEKDRLVAKLPKFAYDAENEVYNAISANINKYRYPKEMPLR